MIAPALVIVALATAAQTTTPGTNATTAAESPWREVTPRFAFLVEYFAHPGLHQSFTAISPRSGLRWLSGNAGVSLDAVLSFAARDLPATRAPAGRAPARSPSRASKPSCPTSFRTAWKY